MARFDRYLLSQMMVLFGFFALILVSIYWINQAVRLFDRLVGDGQSAMVFVEFSLLTLPNVIRLVLPVAAFAGAVYVTNRLSNESELVVMQATGFSPWRLARPVAIYGAIVALMMAVLTNLLVPASQEEMKKRESELSQNVTAKLLTEGTFLHPSAGITFYIREITVEGALRDVYLSDRSRPDRAMTYTASEAFLVNDDKGTRLVMVDGLSQAYFLDSARLFTTHFADFTYDITGLLASPRGHVREVRHVGTWELLTARDAVAAETGQSLGVIVDELHGRFNQPLMALAAALIGFSALLVGGFSRFGVWKQIVGALVLLVLVKLIEGLVTDPVRLNPELWPLVYAPSLGGLLMAASLLAWSARPRRRRVVAPPVPGGVAA
ncbi:MAG: LPS export ABC transporter permease LptF [Rhodobacterales bacterium]|nr:LPS export ABC transporter permease LptF [Rhodobacterales bacterium]MDX5390852.1 LPS export ABC transporter permease LptF [Rhodobacterales bacterium]MDX5490547.1 LPS export ABC transporter permease LptF [Rhodobacterales bacterium]